MTNPTAMQDNVAAGLEFPPDAASPPDGLSRRDFVTLLGASMALAAATGCLRSPDEKILPYVETPDDVVPGVPRYYATAMTLDGFGTGVLVESHTGRPTKIEGNPDHPASLGAAGVYEQGSVLQLYDPCRARAVRAGRRQVDWSALETAFRPVALQRRVGARGAGLSIVLPPTTSPLVAAMLDRVRATYPEATVHFAAPIATAAGLTGTRSVFGSPLVPHYDLQAAEVVVVLDADPLASGPFHLRYANDWASRRRRGEPSRLHVAEATPSPTGTVADHRLAARWTDIPAIAAALLDRVSRGGSVGGQTSANEATAPTLSPAATAWVNAAARDLSAHRGRAAVIAGATQPADVHVLAAAINDALGSIGQTVWYAPSPILDAGGPEHDTGTLVGPLASGSVDTLVMLEGNPCYGYPSDLELARHIRGVPNTLYLGTYDDETARSTTWFAPAAHYLESWGDTRAYDGTRSLVQPLIAPLYDGRTTAELLAIITGEPNATGYRLLRDQWARDRGMAADGDPAWVDALRRGVVADSAATRVTPRVRPEAVDAARHTIATRPRESAGARIEVGFSASRSVHDGQFADVSWLQELPDPITKLTWDNAALIAPALANRLGLATGDVVRLERENRGLDIPALVVPGQADGTIALALGYGRSGAESVARGVGVDVNALRDSTPLHAPDVTVRPTGRRHELAITQTHWSIEGRGESVLGRKRTETPSEAGHRPKKRRRPLTLYEPAPPPRDGFADDQWAMVIDLDVCTGCSACVVACQAENNVPNVGKEGVLASREMHWLRIDRYVEGASDEPRFATQPMLCQHCEKAPCEYVCPVNATVHSDDGLNEMVYNRCVGTRFCSNNCPYKVRRFNWFDYNAEIAETERMVKNPNVTVRARGVMEKCTFCVQRIRSAQATARLADEPKTGPVTTACQQACPTHAIVFGSLTDDESEVSKSFDDPRAFSALDELGTVPRVHYLARRAASGHATESPTPASGE